jgi:hypothetical protein
MEFDGDVLSIDIDMSIDEVQEFEEFIRTRIDYIETIDVKEDGELKSSALIAILTSLKRTKPELNIPFFREREFNL